MHLKFFKGRPFLAQSSYSGASLVIRGRRGTGAPGERRAEVLSALGRTGAPTVPGAEGVRRRLMPRWCSTFAAAK